MKLIGITRVRNEALIIADTVEHHLGHCDSIILYDDYSQDDTVNIAKEVGGDRIEIICGKSWRTNREAEETRHRDLLLNKIRELGADWCFCFDADERLVGSLPENPPLGCQGYRLRLFDGYLTPQRQGVYSGGPLVELQRMWGPEYRDILMMFRAGNARYQGLDKREPLVTGQILQAEHPNGDPVVVKHYGKCLSVEHWEETCEYYSTHFPKYRAKWEARKGKAIHTKSDFGRPLFNWKNLMFNSGIWRKI